MVFVGVLLGVAVLTGLAVWAFRRRGTDEMHSVAGYQHRLERLEELRRRQSGAVRIVGGSTPSQREEPALDDQGRIEITSTTRRRVSEDTRQVPTVSDRPIPATYRRGRDVSIARMGHRPRRLGAPIAAGAAVIVLVIVLAILGAHAKTPPAKKDANSHKGHSGHSHATTTTTTVPPTFTASSVNAPDATYSLPFSSSYTVLIKGTGSGGSYVEITNASGSVPYAQVLGDGQSEQLVLTGDSNIDIGRPSDVTVEVDKTAVTFPTPLPAPLHLLFNPQSSSSTTTSSTTTSTTS